MVITVIGLLVGLVIFVAGIFYLHKEKEDAESRKIYGITAGAGGVIFVAMVLRLLFFV